MTAVDLISERLMALVAAHTTNEMVLNIAHDVATTYYEVSRIKDQNFDPNSLDIDASAREVLWAAMIAMKETGKKDTDDAYGLICHLVYFWEFRKIYAAINEFVRIATTVYLKSN